MRYFFLSATFIVLGVLYGFTVGVAGSWELERTNRFDIWMEESLQWLDQNSVYDVSAIKERPIVVLADYDTLQYLWKMRTGRTTKVGAFYSIEVYGSVDDGTQRVVHKLYLLMNFNPKRVSSAKSGVHELVHFLQRVTGAMDKFQCPAESELEAYNLTADWAEEMGEKDFSWLARYRAHGEKESQCK